MLKNRMALLSLGQKITRNKSSQGFTLIELLLVFGFIAFLIGLSTPLVYAIRSEIALEERIHEVKNDLILTLNHALSGKSLAMQNAQAKSLPSAYSIHFKISSDQTEEQISYFEYAENDSGILVPIYKNEVENLTSPVHLKSIRLLGDDQKNASSATIAFFPPFGKVFFLSHEKNSHLNISKNELEENNFQEIQLTFQYKENPLQTRTISFTKSKIIQIF